MLCERDNLVFECWTYPCMYVASGRMQMKQYSLGDKIIVRRPWAYSSSPLTRICLGVLHNRTGSAECSVQRWGTSVGVCFRLLVECMARLQETHGAQVGHMCDHGGGGSWCPLQTRGKAYCTACLLEPPYLIPYLLTCLVMNMWAHWGVSDLGLHTHLTFTGHVSDHGASMIQILSHGVTLSHTYTWEIHKPFPWKLSTY